MVANAPNPRMLEALQTAHQRGWVLPFVVGPEADIHRTAAECGCSLDGFTVVDAEDPLRLPLPKSGVAVPGCS
jgi:phosphotransacetylase